VAFATVQDVGARLRRTLTADEEEQAEQLLEMATIVIADAVGKTQAWADELDTDVVPRVLWVLCLELVSRSMDNPSGFRSLQETLGQYSRSISYLDSAKGGGMFLTEREILMARRAVNGGLSGSARVGSIVDDESVCS
jgi:hypothetical protein